MASPYHLVRLTAWGPGIEELLEYDRQQAADIGVRYTYTQCNTEDEIIAATPDADMVMVSGRPMTRRVIESMPKCKLIACGSVGFDYVDLQAATERNMAVTNVPLFCVDEVADVTMALLLACERKVVLLHNELQKGRWARDLFYIMPGLKGAVLGLIGIGNIGRRVARRAQPFGMQVIAYDAYVSQESASQDGIQLVGMDELLARSDFVSVHVPLNASTHHLMGEAQFRAMKPTAIFLNTSRGGTVDEQALVRALKENWIRGAGLDVFEVEPLPTDSPLIGLPNAVITPHAAGYSEIARQNQRTMSWDVIRTFVSGQWPKEVVNPAVKQKVVLGV